MATIKEFVERLEKKGLVKHVKREVAPVYEVSTLMKVLDGTPLWFEKVKGHEMPVVANICSTKELISIGLGVDKKDIVRRFADAIDHPVPAEVKKAEEYIELPPDLTKLPILTYYPFDGGSYIASGIVVANDPEYGLNASYHRTMVIDKDRVVQRILPRHFHKYIERGLREFAFCIGPELQVLLAAGVSTDVSVSELDIANALRPISMIELDGHVVPESEIVIIMELTGEEHSEGPFLDLTETPDIVRQQPVSRVKKIFVKENAVFHALLPGGLEHKTLMGMPREPTILREVSKVCEVKDVLITPGGCSWLHGAVSIVKKHADDGKKAIEAAFKGHTSMKHVFVVDDDIDINDPNQIEWAMATRFQADKDLVLYPNVKGSSLDPSADPNTRLTCKAGFDLTIPWEKGKDKEKFKKPDLPMKIDPRDYVEM